MTQLHWIDWDQIFRSGDGTGVGVMGWVSSMRSRITFEQSVLCSPGVGQLTFLKDCLDLCLVDFQITFKIFFLGVLRLPRWRTTLTLVSKVTENAGRVPPLVKRIYWTVWKTGSLSVHRPSHGWGVLGTVLSVAAVAVISVLDRKTLILYTSSWIVSYSGYTDVMSLH